MERPDRGPTRPRVGVSLGAGMAGEEKKRMNSTCTVGLTPEVGAF